MRLSIESFYRLDKDKKDGFFYIESIENDVFKIIIWTKWNVDELYFSEDKLKELFPNAVKVGPEVNLDQEMFDLGWVGYSDKSRLDFLPVKFWYVGNLDLDYYVCYIVAYRTENNEGVGCINQYNPGKKIATFVGNSGYTKKIYNVKFFSIILDHSIVRRYLPTTHYVGDHAIFMDPRRLVFDVHSRSYVDRSRLIVGELLFGLGTYDNKLKCGLVPTIERNGSYMDYQSFPMDSATNMILDSCSRYDITVDSSVRDSGRAAFDLKTKKYIDLHKIEKGRKIMFIKSSRGSVVKDTFLDWEVEPKGSGDPYDIITLNCTGGSYDYCFIDNVVVL